MTRIALVLGLGTIALAATAPDALAQSYVNQRLNQIVGQMRNEGYGQSHLRTTGSLREGQMRTYTIRLTAGSRYAIGGVCDEDCSDLDLMLYDSRGNLVDQDEGTDDEPVVAVTARRTGSYRVRVRMYACSVEPCGFGLVVFGN
ncbi:MAG: hypothetical protein IAE99_08170 [Rhodothermales bacterium]|nr:hypothetical protein [Rhodothermales bacterium]